MPARYCKNSQGSRSFEIRVKSARNPEIRFCDGADTIRPVSSGTLAIFAGMSTELHSPAMERLAYTRDDVAGSHRPNSKPWLTAKAIGDRTEIAVAEFQQLLGHPASECEAVPC